MAWIKYMFLRNIFLYAALLALFTLVFDHAKARDQRSRYLLGIYYNGHFKNDKDGIVYFDYMVRQEPNNPQHQAGLTACYTRLGGH